MPQHRKANSSGQNSAVHLHVNNTNHSFEDNNVNILAREDRWIERGVKESIYVKLESPSLRNPHEGWLGQRRTSGPNDYETQSSQVSITTL